MGRSNRFDSGLIVFISIILLIFFISIGYLLWDVIGSLLGLAISLILITILKNFIKIENKKITHEKKDEDKETSDSLDNITNVELESKDEKEVKSTDEEIVFDTKDENFAVGLAPLESEGYSIEQGVGGGKLELKQKNIFSKGPIHAKKAIYYDLSIEDIKKIPTEEILDFIKNGKDTDSKMEFLESIIWELNELNIYDKYICLINIAENLYKKNIRSGARYLYRNLESTCKNIQNNLVKSRIYRQFAVSYSDIGEIKKSGEYFTKGYKICVEIKKPSDKIKELIKYTKAAKQEEFPKLTNSMVIQSLHYIRSIDDESLKKEGLLNLLDTLYNTNGSRLTEKTIKEIKSMLDQIEVDNKQVLFEKFIPLTAKEGFEEFYENLVEYVQHRFNIPYEILYEIPYERLGEYKTLKDGFRSSLDSRDNIPYEYKENYNQGILIGLIKKEDVDVAYRQIKNLELIDDKNLLSKIVLKKLEQEDIGKAKKIVLQNHLSENTEKLMTKLIERGKIQEAKSLSEKLNFKDEYKLDMDIAVDLGKQKKFIKSRHLFEEVEEKISEIEDIDKKIDEYIDLAKKMRSTLKNNNSLDILKRCIYYSEDINKTAEIFGIITTCGYEEDAFKNALNVKDEKKKSVILEKMGLVLISSIKELPKDIVKLVQTIEKNIKNKNYKLDNDRDLFEDMAIALIEGEDHIDQMFRIEDIYKDIKKIESKKNVNDQKKLESIASWAKTKRKEISDQE